MKRSVEYIIVDMIDDNVQVEKLKHCMADNDVKVLANIEHYFNDNHMQMDEHITSFYDLYYDDYINKSETLFVITDISKKQWQKFRNEVVNSQFYPLNMIRIMRDDSLEKIVLKIKTHSKIDRFYDKYTLLATNNIQKMQHEVFDTIKANIKLCPYCKGDSFKIINDVEEFEKDGRSINDSGAFGSFAEHLNCNICHKTISSKVLMMICDTPSMSTLRMR